MGDRGNIVVRQDNKTNRGDVWFYTHWRGSDIQEIVKAALKRKERWNDGSYLARIIFCELVKGQEASETGFGISTRLQDNEYDIVLVNVARQTVHTFPESVVQDDGFAPDQLLGGVKFDDYIK